MSQPQRPRPVPTSFQGIPAGRIFGVPLVVSPAWLVLVVVATLALPSQIRQHLTVSEPASYAVAGGLVVVVYASVLLHEASHVLVARALGMRVGRVVLQLLGAVSEVLDEPTTAGREYLVAAIGPTTSVVLAGGSAAIGGQFAENTVPWLLAWTAAFVNGVVAAFNLLPGLPLDGGHLLRAAMWQRTGDRLRGQLLAGYVGRGLAVAVAVSGILFSHALVGDDILGPFYAYFLAFFLWINASVAIAQAQMRSALPDLSLTELVRPALTVDPQLPLAEAVRRARDIGARALVVVDSRDRWAGIVSEAAVQATPVDRQPWISVSDLARPVEKGLVLTPDLGGEALMAAVQEMPASEYLVAGEDGKLRGVLARVDLVAALRAAGVR